MLPQGLTRLLGLPIVIEASNFPDFYCGLNISEASDAVSLTQLVDPELVVNGNPVTQTGELSCTVIASATPPLIAQNGMFTDAFGRLLIVFSGAEVLPLSEQNGYVFDANGALLVIL